PAATEWDDFGTQAGPSSDEAGDWLVAVCAAYGALVEHERDRAGLPEPLVVSASYGVLGDPVIGACLAHRSDLVEHDGVLDLDRMRRADGGFAAELPAAARDW